MEGGDERRDVGERERERDVATEETEEELCDA